MVTTRTRAIVTGRSATAAPNESNPPRAGDNKRPTKEMKELAEQFFIINAEANAARSSADAKRKTLFKMMKDVGMPEFAVTVKIEGKPVTLDVEVATPDTNYIDPAVLKGLVKPDIFMKIIEASKKSVETHAGKNIAIQAERTRPGTRNVTVKARKD